MASFKEKQLKKKIDEMFGNSPQAEEIKNIVLKANTTGFTEKEIEEYKRQKEEDLKAILVHFQLPNGLSVPSQVIYNKIISNDILAEADGEPN